MEKFQRSGASLFDRRGFRRADVHARTFPHVVILGVERDGGLALHQIDQLMSILVRPDIQLFAWIKPAEGADYVLSAAEFFIQNFRELSRTGKLGVRNLFCIDKGQ